jgi:hypothetical protein
VIERIQTERNWVKSTELLAGLALFVLAALFFYDLYNGRYLLTERDLGPYFIPPRFFWVESIKNGDFPLWNPYQFSGYPFFANPQHAILYPLNVLFFILPFDVAFNTIIILHFFLGGLFTYLLLRDLRVSPSGSLLSGLIFMLSGHLLSLHSLLTCLLSVIWTPLIMLFFRRALIHPGLRNEILTAVFMTISFLGGGVEIVYGNFIVLLLMIAFARADEAGYPGGNETAGKPLRRLLKWRGILVGLRSLFIVSIGFLFLSAIQLIPFFELFIHSIRSHGISYQEATIWSFAPKDILLFFIPDAYGYFNDIKKYWLTQCWLKTLYTGGLPFILSLAFFLSPHLRLSSSGERNRAGESGRDKWLYGSLIFLSLFLSLGRYNPLYSFVFKYAPFFNGIRYPVKFLYIFFLGLSVTAGLGFDRLQTLHGERKGKKWKHPLIFLSLLCGLFLLSLVLGHQEVEHFLRGKGVDIPDFNFLSVNLYHAKRFLFYLALFFLLLRVGHEVKWKGWVKVLVLLFLTADLFGNMGFYGKDKTTDYFRKTQILEILSSDKGHFRTFSTAKTISLETPILIARGTTSDALKEKHLPSMKLLYGIHDIWGIDVIRLKRSEDLYRALTGAESISETNLIDLYGVKYVMSVTPIERDPRFELIYAKLDGLQGKKEDLIRGNTIKLYRNRTPFPRAWLVKQFRVLDSDAVLPSMMAKDFRPHEEALLEESPRWVDLENIPQSLPVRQAGAIPNPKSHGGSETREPLPGLRNEVKIVSECNNRLDLLVQAAEESLLVLSDTYFPGWKAYVDGRKEKILRANYNFRAVPVTPGEHRVEFTYDPWSFKLGGVITFLSLMACIGLCLSKKS